MKQRLSRCSDDELGRTIGDLISTQAAANLPASAILSHVQDLLGADTALLGPIRDLLVRPAYRQLFSEESHSILRPGRDALLQDLSLTYHPAVVARLAAVIDASLGLPPASVPAAPADPGAAAGGWTGSPASAPPPTWTSHPQSDQGTPPRHWSGASAAFSQPPGWARR